MSRTTDRRRWRARLLGNVAGAAVAVALLYVLEALAGVHLQGWAVILLVAVLTAAGAILALEAHDRRADR